MATRLGSDLVNKINFKHYVTFGRISSISKDVIRVKDETLNRFYNIDSEDVYDPKIYPGENIAIIHYLWETPFGFDIVIDGIIDKYEYDNVIRDSQRVPKGWKQEPKVVLVEDVGVMEYDTDYTTQKAICSFRPNNDQKRLYSIEGYKMDEGFKPGVEAVAQTYYITRPNGETSEHKQVLTMAEYDLCLGVDHLKMLTKLKRQWDKYE